MEIIKTNDKIYREIKADVHLVAIQARLDQLRSFIENSNLEIIELTAEIAKLKEMGVTMPVQPI